MISGASPFEMNEFDSQYLSISSWSAVTLSASQPKSQHRVRFLPNPLLSVSNFGLHQAFSLAAAIRMQMTGLLICCFLVCGVAYVSQSSKQIGLNCCLHCGEWEKILPPHFSPNLQSWRNCLLSLSPTPPIVGLGRIFVLWYKKLLKATLQQYSSLLPPLFPSTANADKRTSWVYSPESKTGPRLLQSTTGVSIPAQP